MDTYLDVTLDQVESFLEHFPFDQFTQGSATSCPVSQAGAPKYRPGKLLAKGTCAFVIDPQNHIARELLRYHPGIARFIRWFDRARFTNGQSQISDPTGAEILAKWRTSEARREALWQVRGEA